MSDAFLIRFKTPSSYTVEEIESLRGEFEDFLSGFDEDIDTSTIEVIPVDEEQAKAETVTTTQDFLENSKVTVRLEIQHPDHEKPLTIVFSDDEDGE